MDKVTRQCPQTTTFLKREESRSGIEPRSLWRSRSVGDSVALGIVSLFSNSWDLGPPPVPVRRQLAVKPV